MQPRKLAGYEPPPAVPAFSYNKGGVVELKVGLDAYVQPVHTGGKPDTYAVFSGTLPAGTGLDTKTGVISGKPTTISSGSAVIRATNSDGTGDATFSWNVT